MIEVFENTKIYVYCPAGVVTGGAELLHQLVSTLNDLAKNAYIVYFGNKDHVIPAEYASYNIKTADKVEDDGYNIEVIYEGIFNFVRINKRTQKVLWWLSVDNFYLCSLGFLSIKDIAGYSIGLAIKSFCKRLCQSALSKRNLFKSPVSLRELKEMNALNCYQSEYAQYFLQKNGFGETVSLKDFINVEHCVFDTDNLGRRENIVLYNPKKGLEYTEKIIRLSRDLKWVPIQNMKRAELIELMRRAKVYVDFGYHPGKDRLPRECAMNGCCIITGKRGSAAFFEDVPILNKYKFNENTVDKKYIIDRIRWTLDNYNSAINDFAYYRRQIRREKQEFEKQVVNIFIGSH